MTDANDPIFRMVTIYNQTMGVAPDDVTPRQLAKQWDAMWSALHELKSPGARLLYESQVAGVAAANDWKSVNYKTAWEIMIEKLLEVR